MSKNNLTSKLDTLSLTVIVRGRRSLHREGTAARRALTPLPLGVRTVLIHSH